MSISYRCSPPDTTPSKDSVVCRICGMPIPVENAKADEDRKAVHEICYAWKVRLEQASHDGQTHPVRAWKVIAEEVAHERDQKKMNELIAELNQALDEQNLDGAPKRRPHGTRLDGK